MRLRPGAGLRGIVVAVAVLSTGWMAVEAMAPTAARGAAAGVAVPAALSSADLLARLVDPAAAAAPVPSGARVVQQSSHDRAGGNFDGGVYDPVSAAVFAPPSYLAKGPDGFLLADEHQPGCLARMWMTGFSPTTGAVAAFGNIRLYFDGESAPRFDEPATEFFAGRVSAYPAPLVGDHTTSSGGNFSYVPFCFARSLRVIATGALSSGSSWYQLTLLRLPLGSAVSTWVPGQDDLAGAASRLAAAGRAPAGPPAATASAALAGGGRLELPLPSGPASLRYLQVRVSPWDAASLQRLRLRVAADGTADQVDVPLADVFGDGLETRPIRSLLFGQDPAAATGYLAIPVPYRSSLRVSVVAGSPAQVAMTAWTGPPLPDAGVLHGAWHSETPGLGTDISVLDDPGSGHLAAMVLDLVGQEGSQGALESFMEGDERVHVDGSRSPSVYGTGTEDAFNGGFYYASGAFTLPTHGAGPEGTAPLARATQSQYRIYADDGIRWERGLHWGIEHGGGGETPGEVAAAAVWWYGGPPTLARTDDVDASDPASAAAHNLNGGGAPASLAAYFEGDRDGNLPVSSYVIGGEIYPAPPAAVSPEGFTARGLTFTGPLSFTVAVDPANRGVILRRLWDDGAAPSHLDVAVDGRPVGAWVVPDVNPSKRWREDDFEIPAALTAGARTLRLTLTPAPGGPEAVFHLDVFSRA
jgi:hypothetical protein